MKKIIYLCCAMFLVITLSGCKGENKTDNGKVDQPQVPFNKTDLEKRPNENQNNTNTNNNTGNNQEPVNNQNQTDSEVKQVLNIPVYQGASMTSYTEEENSQSASYRTPKGASGNDVLDYYAKQMPALGWTKVNHDADRSVTYQNSNNQKAEIWIYYDHAEEGTDYVIESPPFTGHPAASSQ